MGNGGSKPEQHVFNAYVVLTEANGTAIRTDGVLEMRQ